VSVECKENMGDRREVRFFEHDCGEEEWGYDDVVKCLEGPMQPCAG
jgi:hypothetical protein